MCLPDRYFFRPNGRSDAGPPTQYRRTRAPDREFPRLTHDAPTADAAPARSSGRPDAAAPAALGVPGMTRAQWRRMQSAGAAYDAAESVVQTAAAAAAASPTVAFADEKAAGEAVAPAHQASIAEAILAEAAVPLTRRRRDRRLEATGAPLAGTDAAGSPIPATFAAAVPAVPVAPADVLEDEFERVARLFAFTGQTPVQRAADAVIAQEVAAAPAEQRRIARRGLVARIAAGSFSLGAMAVVGLLAVGTTSPALAIATVGDASGTVTAASATTDLTAAAAAPKDIQAFVSAQGSDAITLDRSEGFDVASMADVAAESGVTIFAGTWVNDPTAEVQWPFPVGVPISAAYGSQSYLSQFSTPHHGVDLTPGLGAEIHAIAAGTVRIATEAGGDYGVTVVIDHVVDGQQVSTRYGHMLRGSLQVEQGDTVTAGQVIGKVGQTGKATGPHLHLEVLLNGTTRTDPMAWLEEHTSR